MPRGTGSMEVTMTQDDKKTYLWTFGIVGLMVVLVLIAYSAGVIPTGPAS